MKFGGHETFHIRDGWLRKGLSLCDVTCPDSPGHQSAEAADVLGVGANMIKSIRHWLQATSLSKGVSEHEGGGKVTESTELAAVIQELDPHFQSDATWWALHVNLTQNIDFAFSWDWFFNDFGASRFEKSHAIETLRRFLDYNSNLKCPALRTLERDLTVLLNCYAQTIPGEVSDPEDTKDCPLQRLGLLNFFKESGFYSVNFGPKNIPPRLLGYCIAGNRYFENEGADYINISLNEAASGRGGPGRVFAMRAEELYDLALKGEEELGEEWISIRGMAGSRLIQIKNTTKENWLGQELDNENKKQTKWQRKLEKQLLETT